MIIDRGFLQTDLVVDTSQHIYIGSDIIGIAERAWTDLSPTSCKADCVLYHFTLYR